MRAAIFALMLTGACAAPAPDVFSISVQVRSDRGAALPEVPVRAGELPPVRTDSNGTATLRVQGERGQRVVVQAQCPEGLDQEPASEEVALRKLRGLAEEADGPRLRVDLVCHASTRRAAIVVYTPGHAELPVRVDGDVLGHTDAEGVAHVLVERPPSSTMLVKIETPPGVRPANPERMLTIEDRDELFVFDPDLEKPVKKRRRRRNVKREPKPTRPYRLD